MAVNKGFDYLLRRLRLRHLELLVALAEVRTMRAAATRLHLSQPAISKMLLETEEALGGRLFERSRQGVQPTPAGAAALHRARVVLSELAHARDEVEAIRSGASAVLRVGTFSVTAAVPAAVVQLRQRLPGAAVHLREGSVRELIHRLLEGELDCVFGALTNDLLTSDQLRSLQYEVLLHDQLCVLAAESNSAWRRRRLRWIGLQGASWVAPPKDTLVRQAFMTVFLNEGIDPPEPVIEAMSSVTATSTPAPNSRAAASGASWSGLPSAYHPLDSSLDAARQGQRRSCTNSHAQFAKRERRARVGRYDATQAPCSRVSDPLVAAGERPASG
jgi:DNA-binding transcriptional LysR family regulator